MGSVIVANVVNVALDIVFMKFLEMGVAGASLASLIGNAIGIFVCMPYLFFKDRTLRFSFSFSQSKEVVSELIASSSSFAVDKISRVVSGFIVNVLLIYFSGNMAVALYAVYGRRCAPDDFIFRKFALRREGFLWSWKDVLYLD